MTTQENPDGLELPARNEPNSRLAFQQCSVEPHHYHYGPCTPKCDINRPVTNAEEAPK